MPLFAEGNDKFFPKAVDAELEFVKDSGGKISSLVLHQNGHDTSMTRLNDAEAKRIADQAAARTALAEQRFKDQKPTPDAEAAIRQNIADIVARQPKYDRMSPGLAGVTRQQLPQLKSIFANLGAIKSVTLKRVEKNGADTERKPGNDSDRQRSMWSVFFQAEWAAQFQLFLSGSLRVPRNAAKRPFQISPPGWQCAGCSRAPPKWTRPGVLTCSDVLGSRD